MFFSALVLSSCKKEKESRTIITTFEEPQISKTPKAIGDTVINSTMEWGSSVYSYRVERKADKDAIVKDEDGQKYYDNTVALSVSGPDGEIFNKTFSKGNFSSYINSDYIKPNRSVLIGIAFNRVEKGGNAIFVATIGSPDTKLDEFMSVQINIDKSGAMTMNRQNVQDEEMTE